MAFIQFYNRTEAENGKMDAGWVVDICWLGSGLGVSYRIRVVANRPPDITRQPSE